MTSVIPRKLALPSLLVGALLCMGAKWAEKPIESLTSIAGEWRGNGDAVEGYGSPGRGRGIVGIISYVFKEDGSYTYSWAEPVKSDRGQRPAGTVRLHAGKLEWKIPNGLPWTATLYEDKKGKRRLKGHREDGGTWTLKARGVPLTAKAVSPQPLPVTPVGAQATRTTAYRIAMFPTGGGTKCSYLRRPQQKIASDVRALVQDNDSLMLVYSHYDKSLDKPSIKKPDRLWKGDVTARMTPNTKLIYTLAQERNIDAIVMYFQPDFIGYCTDQRPPYPITIYLIDVRQKKTYSRKGHEKDLRAMTSQVIADFMEGRPSEKIRRGKFEKPIEDVKDVVGMWKGMYEAAQGGGNLFVATLEIKGDGSYEAHRGSGSARGMVQIRDGKLQYQDVHGYTLRLTLYERKGKRILEGMSGRGSSFKFKRVEEKRRSKK